MSPVPTAKDSIDKDIFLRFNYTLSYFSFKDIDYSTINVLYYQSDEFGNKECAEIGNASWCLDGTNLALLFPPRIKYITWPAQYLSHAIEQL
uniref:Uncharacterized protein n=1 Tax=Heterorhabditis bacteriophora TaxID=37862 RepID=A0A1I7XEA7_HETBA